MRTADYKEKEIEPKVFRLFFKKCREAVESNTRIVRLRELKTDLELRGRALKEKLKQFCR